MFPDLKKCKSKHEAENLIARLEENAIVNELASRAEKSNPETPIEIGRKELMDRYMIGDFFERISEIADSSIDLIDLDPPYAIDYKDFTGHDRYSSTVVEKFKRDGFVPFTGQEFPIFISKIFAECWRILKPKSWLLTWYAQEPWGNLVYQCLHKANFELKAIPAVWCKDFKGSGRPSACPDNYLGRSHETFYYARCGKAFIKKRGRSDVFHYQTPRDRIHPTEKPVELMEDIFSTFCLKGDEIFIPFLGSGNGILAAANLNMRARGFEKSEEYKKKFILRAAEWSPK